MTNKTYVKMTLKRIVIDEARPEQVISLKQVDGNRSLVIVIGYHEAVMMKLEVSKVHTNRPLTLDLLKNTLDGLDVKLPHVTVDSVDNGTFFGSLYLKIKNTGDVEKDYLVIDSRPSDAIALALKCDAHILVSEEVLDKAGSYEN